LITGGRGRRDRQRGRTAAARTVVAVDARRPAAVAGRVAGRRGVRRGRSRRRRGQREQRGVVMELVPVDGGRRIRSMGGPAGDGLGDGARRAVLRPAGRRRRGVRLTGRRRRNGVRRRVTAVQLMMVVLLLLLLLLMVMVSGGQRGELMMMVKHRTCSTTMQMQ